MACKRDGTSEELERRKPVLLQLGSLGKFYSGRHYSHGSFRDELLSGGHELESTDGTGVE